MPYTLCRLFYDGLQHLQVGDFLLTPAGSAYSIEAVRRNRKRHYRWHLLCTRWPKEEIPPGATVHPLHWYPRNRRRTTLKTIASRSVAATQ